MEFNHNVTGERRKALVSVISDASGIKAVYKFMPAAAYEIGGCTIAKDGTMITDETIDEATLNKAVVALADAGFTTDTPELLMQRNRPDWSFPCR